IVTIGTPFGWALVNFHQNIIVNRSADFGVAPPQAYLATINSSWQLATLPILALTLPVLRRFYALMAMAAVNLAVHSAIGHKEYRFIFLSVAIVVIVAVIGSAELVWRNRERLSGGRLRLFAGGLVAAWIALSAALGSASWLNYGWQQFAAGSQAVTALRSEPSLCGVGLLRVGFWDTGGYTYLHRPLPIYVISDLPAQAAAFDSIIADRSSVGAIPPAYSRSFCSSDGRLCTFVRPGGCESNAAAQQRLDRVMVRRNW
ncbi:MAG TPA: hypothetical protein VGX37_13310, partial [Allosphingosinicella sp.]|nr:hypothetical protein [Allosphingosinicella sp.]